MRMLAALASGLLFGNALAFSDVPASDPSRAAIENLRAAGVIRGYADGTFRSSNPVTRAEFVKVVLAAAGLPDSPSSGDVRCFRDFRGAEEWYWQPACAARERGLLQGYPDGTFRGGKLVTLAEALKIAFIAFEVPLPQYFRAPDHWYDPYMDAMAGLDIFFLAEDPRHALTRGETARLLDVLRTGFRKTTAEERRCISSEDCLPREICSMDSARCLSPCPYGDMACMRRCTGVCVQPGGAQGLRERPPSG